jgi:hypothetical protein
MDPIDLTISDGEETYIVVARPTSDGRGSTGTTIWHPGLFDLTGGNRAPIWPPGFRSIEITYSSPWSCLDSLLWKVYTELFGYRA